MFEELIYCRKCQNKLPSKDFYESVDGGYLDSNGYMSVCKNCINSLFDKEFEETKSLEKSIHKLCRALNISYSSEAVDATKAHINTSIEKGRNVNVIFSIYKMKLTATIKNMDKSKKVPTMYEDVNMIYITEAPTENIEEDEVSKESVSFWGNWLSKEDIKYLENQFNNFKKTHKADTEAEIVLLKEVCYTMLKIQNLRKSGDDTQKEVKELQEIMKNLAISPNIANVSSSNKGMDSFGLWIRDIEKYEPAEWRKSDPRGDMYRDVGNVDKYYEQYITRALQNFATQSKDFNIEEIDSDVFEDDDLSIMEEENSEE